MLIDYRITDFPIVLESGNASSELLEGIEQMAATQLLVGI